MTGATVFTVSINIYYKMAMEPLAIVASGPVASGPVASEPAASKPKRSFKIKAVQAAPIISEPVPTAPKRTFKVKKSVEPVQPEEQVKVIKTKKVLPVPPPPPHGIGLTLASEAFEAIREYYAERDEAIPNEEIKWYEAELIAEKREYNEFWDRCCVTRAIMDAVLRGEDEIGLIKAEMDAKALEKKQPIRKEDIGDMPAYGTPEFWSWCRKRKLLKQQEDAAIIAAGGTVKPVKPKKKVV